MTALGDYYRTCGIPKASWAKPTPAQARKIKLEVFARQRQVCIGRGVNPQCTFVPVDPHELMPRGLGYPVALWNTVGVCRACHSCAQDHIGGNPLQFDWTGKADGALPRADVQGNVRVRWVPDPAKR